MLKLKPTIAFTSKENEPMKIRFIPEVDPEEKIFGVQFVLENYAIDIYFCFAIFKIGIFRNKGECWSILLGFFRIEGTNLNMGW